MAPTRKKHRKPIRSCVFCDGTRLSKEHIWPNWLRDHVPRDAPYNVHTRSFGKFVDGVGTGLRVDRPRPGDAMSRKLRIVCRTCNNGWMSGLQTICKPFLLPFVAGRWQDLDNTQQQQLAAWATMFTMVWEFRDLRTLVTPRAQHEQFKRTSVPPGGWKIWLGQVVDGWEGAANHIAWKIVEVEDGAEDTVEPSVDTQVTAWCLGSLFLMTFNTINESVHINESEFAALHGLEVLWPLQDRTISKSARALDYATANAVVRAILPPQLEQRFFLDIGELPGTRRPKQ